MLRKKIAQEKSHWKTEQSKQPILTTKLLLQCKQWSGPATSVAELEQILQSYPDI